MDVDALHTSNGSSFTSYVLESTPRIPWSAAHEKGISTDYPLDVFNGNESANISVQRTYSNFLWLPQV